MDTLGRIHFRSAEQITTLFTLRDILFPMNLVACLLPISFDNTVYESNTIQVRIKTELHQYLHVM